MDTFKANINDYYFPKARSNEHLFIKMYNYRTYLTAIFKDFSCLETDNYILRAILYEKMNTQKFQVRINQKQYECLNGNHTLTEDIFPIIKEFNCKYINSEYHSTRSIISGLPKNKYVINYIKNNNNIIPNQFIIKRIVADNDYKSKKIIIIGKFVENLKNGLYKFSLNFFFPNIALNCSLKPYSKYVQSEIYCINNKDINSSEFLVENQIVQLLDGKKELLLINEQTLIKLKIRINNENFLEEKMEYHEVIKEIKNQFFSIVIYIALIILLIIIKCLPRIKIFYYKRKKN